MHLIKMEYEINWEARKCWNDL